MQVNQNFQPTIVAFCCNWCSYAGADLSGTNRLSYPANIKIIRIPCSCRLNPMFILRAFQRGADGVILCGRHPGGLPLHHRQLLCPAAYDPAVFPFGLFGNRGGSGREWNGSLPQKGQSLPPPWRNFTETIRALGENRRLEDLRCKEK